MEESTIKKLATMWALVARMNAIVTSVEAMKALNQYRLNCGEQIAYCEESFSEAEMTLRDISAKLSQLS